MPLWASANAAEGIRSLPVPAYQKCTMIHDEGIPSSLLQHIDGRCALDSNRTLDPCQCLPTRDAQIDDKGMPSKLLQQDDGGHGLSNGATDQPLQQANSAGSLANFAPPSGKSEDLPAYSWQVL